MARVQPEAGTPVTPEERTKLRLAVTDEIIDRMEAEGIDALKVFSDDFWNWYETAIEDPLKKLLCEVDGHDPIRDHCGRPEHDHCAICMTRLPGQAVPRRKEAHDA